MKVFPSHSIKDRKFVEKLAGELRTGDIEPWLCEADVSFGDDLVAQIEQGLQESQFNNAFLIAGCGKLDDIAISDPAALEG
jgi:hypothetical protein